LNEYASQQIENGEGVCIDCAVECSKKIALQGIEKLMNAIRTGIAPVALKWT